MELIIMFPELPRNAPSLNDLAELYRTQVGRAQKTRNSVLLALAVAVAGCAVPQSVRPTSYGASSYPAQVATVPAAPVVDLRSVLEGCVIVAEDGQMLGVITSSAYDTNSFLNEYGPFGSKYGSASIWNKYGKYGNPYSPMSPFNPYSSTPPRIVTRDGQVVCYLTVNEFMSPAISPYALVALME